LSFFDLENELPGWLEGVRKAHPIFTEIPAQNVNSMCAMSKKSYHMVCAGKGNVVVGGQGYQIWKFEEPISNMRTYGKYLEYTSINPHLEFWVGIVVQNKTITPYLWFGEIPDPVRTYLTSEAFLTEEEHGKPDYWYRKKTGNSGQASDTLRDCCGCGTLSLSEEEIKKLEKEVKEAIGGLLAALEQAVQNT
jgi:hypothetical protein